LEEEEEERLRNAELLEFSRLAASYAIRSIRAENMISTAVLNFIDEIINITLYHFIKKSLNGGNPDIFIIIIRHINLNSISVSVQEVMLDG